MKRVFLAVIIVGVVIGMITTALQKNSEEPTPLARLKEQYAKKAKPSVDHTLFAQLNKKFARPQEVTAACISCHNGRHKEVMESTHWNWERIEYIPGKGIRPLGKKNVLNNFCIGISGNEQSCNKCHIGYGYADASFNFADSLNVDCLACHDNSPGRFPGQYNPVAGASFISHLQQLWNDKPGNRQRSPTVCQYCGNV